MKRLIVMSGNFALAFGGMCMAFVVGYMVGIHTVQKQAIERNLAAYCPNDASFSWMEVIEPLEIIMQTADCKE